MNEAPARRRGRSTLLMGDIRYAWTILSLIVLAASSYAQARVIRIVSGTYGQNCGAPIGNATHDLARQCNGRETCRYIVGKSLAADPAVACRKDLLAEWRCSDTEYHTAALSPEAWGSTLVLSCIRQTGAGR